MIRRLLDVRLFGLVAVVAAAFVLAALVPLPSVEQVRAWSESTGPYFPLLFFVAHALATVAPFPRTVFTLSAGLLFGPLTGVVLAVGASTLSALLALILVRAVGREFVAARLSHPAVRTVDDRLARRGWLAVGSLRLIAFVPFSVLNYCAGVSAVRVVPYVLATIVGVIPGTIGVVVLGNALGGHTDPRLLALSGVCIAVGLVGLLVDSRIDGARVPNKASALN